MVNLLTGISDGYLRAGGCLSEQDERGLWSNNVCCPAGKTDVMRRGMNRGWGARRPEFWANHMALWAAVSVL